MSEIFYKAVRPNGASFYDLDFRWLPEGWVSGDPIPTDWVVKHPNPGKRIGRSGTRASEYLSVATVPTDCTNFRWPCVLLEAEAVGRACLDDYYHHKRRVRAARVIRELPAHEAFGPQGAEVVAILERCGRLTAEEIERLRAAQNAWGAAQNAWDAALGAARGAALGAARGAAAATLVRDLITPEGYDLLTAPWREVMGDE